MGEEIVPVDNNKNDNTTIATTTETISCDLMPQNENKIVGGYNKEEQDIIAKARSNRDKLIDNMVASNPRGKELEALVSLIDHQENSAHKTANTRIKIKEEENKTVLNASLVSTLVKESIARRQKTIQSGEFKNVKIEIADELVPNDIVLGETSDIDKSEELNVDDFMPQEA